MTEFTVHLPNRTGSLADLAERLAAVGINIEALAAIGFDESGTVKLIVDDEANAREALAELLGDEGYETSTAPDAGS